MSTMSELDIIRKMARNLMDQYGLHDWTLKFNNAPRQAGLCDPKNTTITLSAPLMLLWTEDQDRDIVLHEIAHALTPGPGSHTRAWRQVFLAMGGSGHRCWSDANDGRPTVPAPYTGVCPGGHPHSAYRRPKGSSCGECAPRFDPHYLIIWTKTTP